MLIAQSPVAKSEDDEPADFWDVEPEAPVDPENAEDEEKQRKLREVGSWVSEDGLHGGSANHGSLHEGPKTPKDKKSGRRCPRRERRWMTRCRRSGSFSRLRQARAGC